MLHRWELEAALHMEGCMDGDGDGDSDSILRVLSLRVDLDRIRMVTMPSAPVQLLAIDSARCSGHVLPDAIVQQAVDSFTLDVETGEVRWLLTAAASSAAGERRLAVAICACWDNQRILLAPPVPFAKVQQVPVAASDVPRWRC